METVKHQSQALKLQQELKVRCEREQKQLKILSTMSLKSEFLQREFEATQDELEAAREKLNAYSSNYCNLEL